MRIDLPGLEAFLGIANWGSFRRAAGHLNLSQAALSHRIRKLEENLGVALLARTTRQVTLTPAGLELLPVAQRMVQEVSATLEGLRERGRTRQERIAIGCLPTIAVLYLPAVLAEFAAERPGTMVQIYDNSAAEIAARVRAGQAEFGVTIVSANSWDLEITPLAKEPFVLILSAAHAFAARPSVSWRELEGEPLIRISAEAGNRQLIDEALGSRRDRMTWAYEVQRVSTAIGLVRAGMGLAIVPEKSIEAYLGDGLTAVALKNPSVARSLGLVTRRGDPLSPGAALLASLIGASLKRDGAASRTG